MAPCYLTGVYLLKVAKPPDSRPPAMWLSLQRIFHRWGIRRTPSERENVGSPVTLSFPSNKFPFSCLNAWLALFFSALALHSGTKHAREDPSTTGWAPLTSPPLVVPSLRPFWETKISSRVGLFPCIAGLTSTHWLTFHISVTRLDDIPYPQILSPHLQVLELGGIILTALGPSTLHSV